MIDLIHGWLNRIPIRVRLTLWYIFLMAVTFTLAGGYLLFRFQSSLINSVDTALQIAVSQSLSSIEDESDLLVFDEGDYSSGNPQGLSDPAFAMQLLSIRGEVLDSFGDAGSIPVWGATEPGFDTKSAPGDDERWRVYSQAVLSPGGEQIGWVQAVQSLNHVTDTLQDFRDQLVWIIPGVLILTGVGGYFLAGRMLKPIDSITSTAAEIEASDLSQRLDYQGVADEIGKLAQTFDRMLERLQAAFLRERRFTEDAAHELRTPLTVLKGQIEVTLNRSRSKTEYQDTLHHLASQVERLIRLSNALLFLSRSDQKQLSWEPTPLNLEELLGMILEQIQPLADEKQLALNTELCNELRVYGDTDHLIRLFLNLFDNAVKYTPSGGQINIQASHDPTGIRVVLHNSGPSIPTEDLPYLFDRFYRVDPDRSSKTGGSGLGLAIAHEIVRLHGGDISVQSAPDQGVSFIVQLPAYQS